MRIHRRLLPTVLVLTALVPVLLVACSDDDPAIDAADAGTPDVGLPEAFVPPIGKIPEGSKVTIIDASRPPRPDTSVPDASDDAGSEDAEADASADADAGPPPDPTSTDGIQNGSETDVDCGGGLPTSAPVCAVTQKCAVVADCVAGAACDATSKRCTRLGHVYAAYYSANVVVGYSSASTRDADGTPTATSIGATGAGAVALDAKNDILYASSITDGKVFIVESGSTSNAGPTRTIGGITEPVGLAVDSAHNRLFVASLSGEKLLVFDDASTLDGTPTAPRTVTFPAGDQPFSPVYDAAHDRLFVSIRSKNRVDVFDNASTMNGTLAMTRSRIIGGSASTISGPQQIAYDPVWDDLYVSNTGAGFQVAQILAFHGASKWNTNDPPSRMIGVAGFTITGVSVDPSRDELYYSGTTWFKIGVLSGAHTFDRTVSDTVDLGRTFTGTQQFPTQIYFEPTQD